MEKFTLKTMTDFLLEQSENYLKGFIALNEYHSITLNYANFLKQPLTLGMFVPCDEDGNLLVSFDDRYEESKERVLFEGFEIPKEGIALDRFKQWLELKCNVESLVGINNLELTPSAVKQIGL